MTDVPQITQDSSQESVSKFLHSRVWCGKTLNFVYSDEVSAALGERHDNYCRPLKRYLQRVKPASVYFLDKRGNTKRWAVGHADFMAFVRWLFVVALKGHRPVQRAKLARFRLKLGEHLGYLLDLNFDDTQQELQTLPADFAPESRMAIETLAGRLGYSTRHMRRYLDLAGRELGGSEEFLGVASDSTVSGKTALWCMLTLPKASGMRLAYFNRMFEKMAEGGQALLTETRHKLEELQKERDDLRQMLQLETGALKAEVSGLVVQKDKLETVIAQAMASGAVVNDEMDIVRESQVLRSQGMKTLTDVEAQLAGWIRLNARNPDLNKLAMSSDMTRLKQMIRFTVGHKELRADGRPVVRNNWQSHVQVHKVFVPDKSSVGHLVKHGTERNWRYGVWYTPEFLQVFLPDVLRHHSNWVNADRPKHHMQPVKIKANVDS